MAMSTHMLPITQLPMTMHMPMMGMNMRDTTTITVAVAGRCSPVTACTALVMACSSLRLLWWIYGWA